MKKEILYKVGAVLILVSVIGYIFKMPYAEYGYAFGAAAYAISLLTYKYEGGNLRVKRLHSMNKISGVLMVLGSFLMFKARTEWVLCVLIAAFLHLYVSFAMPKDEE